MALARAGLTNVSLTNVEGRASAVGAVWEEDWLLAYEAVRQGWLTSTATDAGAPGRDDEFGGGIVDPARAMTAASGALTVSVGDPVTTLLGSSTEIREVSAGAAGSWRG